MRGLVGTQHEDDHHRREFRPAIAESTQAWDSFQILAATAAKLGVEFFHYLCDRIVSPATTPTSAERLADSEQYPMTQYDVWRFDGENLYALPENLQILALYFNRDMFEQANIGHPDETWTWDDVVQAAAQLKQGEGDLATQWGLDLGDLHAWWGLQTVAWAMGGSFFDQIVEPTRLQMSDEPNVKAMQFLQDLLWKENLAPTFSQREALAPGTSVFQAGKAGMLIAGSWSLSSYKDVPFNWDIAPLPKWIDKRVPAFWFGGWVLTKDGKIPETSFEFARWSATDYQQTMAVNHDWIPIRKDARESEAMNKGMPDGFGVTLSTIYEARLGDVYHGKSQQLLNEVLFPALELLFSNKISAAEAAAQMDEAGNKILQESA